MFEAKEINGKFVIVFPDGFIDDREGNGYKSLAHAQAVAASANNPELVRPSNGADI